MYPSIAGQSERYSAQQMALIANGQRTSGASAAMVPFVQDLTPQDMRDIGAYFATQKATAGIADDGAVIEGPYAGKKFYEIGQQLYRGGDAERGIPACMACHGPTGAGLWWIKLAAAATAAQAPGYFWNTWVLPFFSTSSTA